MMASNGAPVGLDNIRKGWQQAEVEQPTFAQVYGIAMFLPMILKGEKPKPGTYKVLGLDAVLTDEEWGPNLKIPGAAITKDNVDDPQLLGQHEDPHRSGRARAVGTTGLAAHGRGRGRRRRAPPLLAFVLDHLVWGILAAILLVCSVTIEHFFQIGIFLNILQHATFVGLLAIGLSFCIIAGHMDLSIESVMAFAAMLAAWLTATPRLAARLPAQHLADPARSCSASARLVGPVQRRPGRPLPDQRLHRHAGDLHRGPRPRPDPDRRALDVRPARRFPRRRQHRSAGPAAADLDPGRHLPGLRRRS